MTWKDELVPASFRGVTFYVEDRKQSGGRRKPEHEFPGRDGAYVEDLGRRPREQAVKAYIVGDDYLDGRDALLDAIENYPTPAALVLPWRSAGQYSCKSYGFAETKKDGGYVVFELVFVEDAGLAPGPVAVVNTSGAALDASAAAFASLQTAFAAAFSTAGLWRFPVTAAGSIVADLASRFGALAAVPATYLTGVDVALATVSAAPNVAVTDSAGLAASVCGAFGAYADAVVAYGIDVSNGDAPSYSSTSVSLASDPTGGLAGLATAFAAAHATFPPSTTPDRIAQGTNQQALLDLVAAATALAVAQIFAQGDFDSSNAASAARDQLVGLFAGPLERAADSDQDDLYQTLMAARATAMADIAARGSTLPALTEYATIRPRTALVLAHLLYPTWPRVSPDASDTVKAWSTLDDIVSDLTVRNSIVHPAFCPTSGLALGG